MDSRTLTTFYKYNHMALRRNLAGITHEESIVRPEPGGNSINWVLGHIVVHQGIVLTRLGMERIWSDEEGEVYARGSQPSQSGSELKAFEDVVAAYERSYELLLKGLEQIAQSDLDADIGNNRTIGDQIGFLQFHEAYHAGQLGILRRIVGKEGAI